MSTTRPNYPDILGYISNGERFSVNGVDAAVALSMPTIRAGQPVDVYVMLQNTTDTALAVNVYLELPEKDARNQPTPVIARAETMNVLLRPAEVGYVYFPLQLKPTMAANTYPIGVELTVENDSGRKPEIVRYPVTERVVNLAYYFFLSEDTLHKLVELKAFDYVTKRRGRFSSGNIIDLPLKVLPPKGKPRLQARTANWISLWALGDHTDVRPLLERFRGKLRKELLPAMQIEKLHKPLQDSTLKRFRRAGFPLEPLEAQYITKLLLSVLDANRRIDAGIVPYCDDCQYRFLDILRNDLPLDSRPVPLPHWCRQLLHNLDINANALINPVTALSVTLYDEILRDAVVHGFNLVQDVLGEQLGTRNDILAYSQQLTQMLWNPEITLGFADVHLPLVLGGLLLDKHIELPGERALDNLNDLWKLLQHRRANGQVDDDEVFGLTHKMLDAALLKYGYKL